MESLFFRCHIESSLQQVGYTHNDHSIKQKFAELKRFLGCFTTLINTIALV